MAEPSPHALRLTVAIVFLNEEAFLPRMLASVAGQTRPPDRLLLVDDGSHDMSAAIARRYGDEHAYARVMLRPRRERAADRLAAAAELQAFQWAVAHQGEPFDVIAKMDGDLELPPRFFEAILAAFDADARLGIAGAPLAVPADASEPIRERSAPWHVRGATKFYRDACWQEISPLPAILGWDTIDEARARVRGWRVESVAVPGGDALHMRVTGTYDGAIRGYRRRGMAAWGYGAHPLNVLASAGLRMRDRPRISGGLAYLGGWVGSAIRNRPRAEPEALRVVRREQRRRLVRALRGGGVR
ncbi:MAG: glycosyltransferase [Actinomycetota bacterium]|nr:glycosyltransferase [Actinomycetota bacterium]